ncbi:hypothetical protein PAMP_015989 [Pampus punctatissimus]
MNKNSPTNKSTNTHTHSHTPGFTYNYVYSYDLTHWFTLQTHTGQKIREITNKLINFYNFMYNCMNSTAGSFSITAFTIICILFLLPLYILVLYVGHQRWREQRSGTAMSNSDLFTYHTVIIELMNILGLIVSCCAVFTDVPQMIMPGIYLLSVNLSVQTFFHILTCVERYLAVVHPVTYLGLKKASGIRIRNITIGCVWFMCLAGTGLMSVKNTRSMGISSLCIIVLQLIIISFCSLHVLCVLIRPSPGERGGSRQQYSPLLSAPRGGAEPFLCALHAAEQRRDTNCLNYRSSFFIFTSFSVTNILLLLPPCILIIYVGLQRWLKNRSALTSHSDMITYHTVAMEMIGIFGCSFYFCGTCLNMPRLTAAGTFLFSVTSNGQIFFHMLTCAELHLAVVYPITYLNLRTRGGSSSPSAASLFSTL